MAKATVANIPAGVYYAYIEVWKEDACYHTPLDSLPEFTVVKVDLEATDL
jgi:hypothetical protein